MSPFSATTLTFSYPLIRSRFNHFPFFRNTFTFYHSPQFPPFLVTTLTFSRHLIGCGSFIFDINLHSKHYLPTYNVNFQIFIGWYETTEHRIVWDEIAQIVVSAHWITNACTANVDITAAAIVHSDITNELHQDENSHQYRSLICQALSVFIRYYLSVLWCFMCTALRSIYGFYASVADEVILVPVHNSIHFLTQLLITLFTS